MKVAGLLCWAGIKILNFTCITISAKQSYGPNRQVIYNANNPNKFLSIEDRFSSQINFCCTILI